MIYSVGPAKVYRAAQEIYGPQYKSGRHDDYSGGCAFETYANAQRYIDEKGPDDMEFAVFGLEAEWNVDTEPSEDSWWHYLLNSRPLIIPPKGVTLEAFVNAK